MLMLSAVAGSSQTSAVSELLTLLLVLSISTNGFGRNCDILGIFLICVISATFVAQLGLVGPSRFVPPLRVQRAPPLRHCFGCTIERLWGDRGLRFQGVKNATPQGIECCSTIAIK